MKSAQRITFCGVLCALSSAVLLASVFPYATYALAALAGILFIPAALELSTRYGVFCYIVTTLLALLITPDPEAKLLFVFFFGYYPLIHLRLAICHHKLLAWGVKLLIFNAAVLSAFAILINIVGIPFEVLRIGSFDLTWVLLPMANAVFVLYDIALVRVAMLYRVRLHTLVKKLFRM